MKGLEAGTRLGPYEVLDALGQGGMGQVYRARDTRLGRLVALKLIRADQTTDPLALERFRAEARTASALNHPNLITVFDVGESPVGHYIAMELVEGHTLTELSAAAVPLHRLLDIALQTAQAVRAAHAAGIVHRDLKPENVMVRDDGYVKVLDFGLSRLQQPLSASPSVVETAFGTTPGMIVGTPSYMSPEQARAETVGPATDVFSLGLVFYQLSTGRHPFAAPSIFDVVHGITSETPVRPTRINPLLPDALDALILQMLDKQPGLRPSSEDLITALTTLAADTRASGPTLPLPARTLRRAAPKTVGHEHERRTMHEAFARARGGRGVLVCVSGEPGAGKTTLVESLLSDLRESATPHGLLLGRCSERLGSTGGYLPVIDAFARLLHEGGSPIARRMQALAPSWYRQLAQGQTSSGSVREEAGPPSRETMMHELAALLEDLTQAAPLVWFMDDVHWVDTSTVELIGYLAGRFESLPLMLVATVRPSELEEVRHPFLTLKLECQRRGACVDVPLSFLDDRDVEAYLRLQFPAASLPEALPRLLHQRTEGSPLFLTELVRDLRDRDVLVEEAGQVRLTQPIETIQEHLPETVRSMIQRKLEYLSDDQRRIMLAAAVQGYEFDSAVVGAAIGRDAVELEEQLDDLDRSRGVITFLEERELQGVPSLRYRFVHVLYQNALYQSIRGMRRASLSRAVAQAIVGCYGGGSGAPAAELACLFDVARDPSSAARFYQLAAKRAARLSAHVEAAALARKAAEMLAKLPDTSGRAERELAARVVLGESLTALRGYADPEVEASYSRAWELCRTSEADSHSQFPAAVGLWKYQIASGRLALARDHAARLVALAARSGRRALSAHAEIALGISVTCLGDVVAGCAHLEAGADRAGTESIEEMVQFGQDAVSSGQVWRILALALRGRIAEAHSLETQTLAQVRELNHPYSLVYVLNGVARFRQVLGDVAGTRTHAEAALTLARQNGFGSQIVIGMIYRGWARPGPDEGEELELGLQAYRRAGAGLLVPHFLSLLADVYRQRGDLARSLATLTEAQELSRATGDGLYAAEIARLRGRVASGLDRCDPDPEGCFGEAIDAARAHGQGLAELRAATDLADLRYRQGRVADARSVLRDACERLATEPVDLGPVKALLAQWAPSD